MVQRTRQLKASAAEQSVRYPSPGEAAARDVAIRVSIDRAAAISAAIPAALFVFALVLLLVRLGQHPPYAYNWESYTTWRFFQWWDNPSTSIFTLTDGLMTDSGASPFLAPIIWLSFKLFGVSLSAMRLPVVLIAATALPLTWVVGRRLVGERAAVLAAVLFGLLPSFLIYGRTATNVGVSLVPALITVYVLIRALKEPRRSQWLALLQLMLVVNSYAYSPIRFLWPICIALFVAELVFQQDARRRLAIGLFVTVVTLPLVLAFIEPDYEYNPLSAVSDYYYARGEQVFAWDGDPEQYKFFLAPTSEEAAAGRLLGSEEDLAWRLVKKNAGDLTSLLLDRDTTPSIIEFWNPHGRLYFGFLVPFFLLGLLKSLPFVFRRTEDRVLQACMWGFSFPLLLTSQVHIGRLVFVFPFVCFFVASGLFWIVDLVVARVAIVGAHIDAPWLAVWRRASGNDRAHHEGVYRYAPTEHGSRLPVALAAGAALLLIVATTRATWADYKDSPPPTRDERIIAQLEANAPEIAASGGKAVLVRTGDNLEIEAIATSTYRLELDGTYQFVNLRSEAPVQFAKDRPVLFYGVVMSLLVNPNGFPSFCENTYFVDPELVPQFLERTGDDDDRCGHPLHAVALVS